MVYKTELRADFAKHMNSTQQELLLDIQNTEELLIEPGVSPYMEFIQQMSREQGRITNETRIHIEVEGVATRVFSRVEEVQRGFEYLCKWLRWFVPDVVSRAREMLDVTMNRVTAMLSSLEVLVAGVGGVSALTARYLMNPAAAMGDLAIVMNLITATASLVRLSYVLTKVLRNLFAAQVRRGVAGAKMVRTFISETDKILVSHGRAVLTAPLRSAIEAWWGSSSPPDADPMDGFIRSLFLDASEQVWLYLCASPMLTQQRVQYGITIKQAVSTFTGSWLTFDNLVEGAREELPTINTAKRIFHRTRQRMSRPKPNDDVAQLLLLLLV